MTVASGPTRCIAGRTGLLVGSCPGRKLTAAIALDCNIMPITQALPQFAVVPNYRLVSRTLPG